MPVLEELERMSEERFLEIYQSLLHEGYGPLDAELARRLKFRPHAIKKLPLQKRAEQARSLLLRSHNAELAYEVFGTYLVKKDKALLIDFLDATGVPHEQGMISDIESGRPAADKVAGAVRALDAKYAPADVTLYLALCAEHWPGIDAVQQAWQGRPTPH
jgi:hypothetical protein